MKLADVAEAITSRFGGGVTAHTEFRGEVTLSLQPDALRPVCEFCRDELGFDLLLDISSIDHLIPVDVYVSGCPPRPEALLDGLMRLQKKIMGEPSFLEQKKELLASI